MGKVARLCNRVEPFTALFWAFDIVLAHLTLPAGLASLHRRTQSMSLYSICMVIVGSILNEDMLRLCFKLNPFV